MRGAASKASRSRRLILYGILPSRLADICCMARAAGLEPKEMCFVSPNRESAPNILLVHMVKGAGRQLTLLEPLFVYEENGSYTEKLKECYR